MECPEYSARRAGFTLASRLDELQQINDHGDRPPVANGNGVIFIGRLSTPAEVIGVEAINREALGLEMKPSRKSDDSD
jgi:hypothetical protein